MSARIGDTGGVDSTESLGRADGGGGAAAHATTTGGSFFGSRPDRIDTAWSADDEDMEDGDDGDGTGSNIGRATAAGTAGDGGIEGDCYNERSQVRALHFSYRIAGVRVGWGVCSQPCGGVCVCFYLLA